MSELKVIKIELNNHGKPIASIQGTTSYYGISPNDTFYPQAEADKVIADKDKEIAELKKEKEYVIEHTAEVINAQERELRHQKYKRCLAMARWCDIKVNYWYNRYEYEQCPQFYFYEKWHKRWLEIAEKFKEAK